MDNRCDNCGGLGRIWSSPDRAWKQCLGCYGVGFGSEPAKPSAGAAIDEVIGFLNKVKERTAKTVVSVPLPPPPPPIVPIKRERYYVARVGGPGDMIGVFDDTTNTCLHQLPIAERVRLDVYARDLNSAIVKPEAE